MMISTAWRAAFAGAFWLVGACAAFAQPWSGPDLERRPRLIGGATENFDIAVAEICFPYLLQNAAPASWQEPHRTGILQQDNPRAPFDDMETFWVGRSVTVGVKESAEGRECMIMADRGEPEELRAGLLARLEQMPAAMTLGGYQYPPGAYTRREFFCGGADGAHYTALVSTGPRTDGERAPALALTIWRESARNVRCDGVAPGAAAGSAFPPDSLTARFADALAVCLSALGGAAGDAEATARRFTLTPAARAAETPLGANADTGVAAFFGADNRIRTFQDVRQDQPDFIMLMLIVDEAGEKCQVSAIGRANFGAALATGLGRGWERAGATQMRGPNGERLLVETSTRSNGLTVTHVYLER